MKADDYLDEYLSEVVARVGKTDEEYMRNKKVRLGILSENPSVLQVIDRCKPCDLSVSDCEDLIAYLNADNNQILSELRICYRKGLSDAAKLQKQSETEE